MGELVMADLTTTSKVVVRWSALEAVRWCVPNSSPAPPAAGVRCLCLARVPDHLPCSPVVASHLDQSSVCQATMNSWLAGVPRCTCRARRRRGGHHVPLLVTRRGARLPHPCAPRQPPSRRVSSVLGRPNPCPHRSSRMSTQLSTTCSSEFSPCRFFIWKDTQLRSAIPVNWLGDLPLPVVLRRGGEPPT